MPPPGSCSPFAAGQPCRRSSNAIRGRCQPSCIKRLRSVASLLSGDSAGRKSSIRGCWPVCHADSNREQVSSINAELDSNCCPPWSADSSPIFRPSTASKVLERSLKKARRDHFYNTFDVDHQWGEVKLRRRIRGHRGGMPPGFLRIWIAVSIPAQAESLAALYSGFPLPLAGWLRWYPWHGFLLETVERVERRFHEKPDCWESWRKIFRFAIFCLSEAAAPAPLADCRLVPPPLRLPQRWRNHVIQLNRQRSSAPQGGPRVILLAATCDTNPKRKRGR